MKLYSENENYKLYHGNMLDMLEVGKAGEHLVCADLIMKGYKAYLTDQGLPYDVIVDINNKLLRIQVKTTLHSSFIPQRKQNYKSYKFNCRRCGKGGRKEYSNDDVDIVAFVCIEDNLIGYLKIEDVRSTMYFRTREQKYFSNKQGIYLEDLTFDKVIGGQNGIIFK
jgi:hypothetical protein